MIACALPAPLKGNLEEMGISCGSRGARVHSRRGLEMGPIHFAYLLVVLRRHWCL